MAADEALLAFGPPLPGAAVTFELSRGARPGGGRRAPVRPACAGWTREGARLGLRGIAAMAVPEAGLGAAINDRLQRAAAPR